jgi:hypothetical protein
LPISVLWETGRIAFLLIHPAPLSGGVLGAHDFEADVRRTVGNARKVLVTMTLILRTLAI